MLTKLKLRVNIVQVERIPFPRVRSVRCRVQLSVRIAVRGARTPPPLLQRIYQSPITPLAMALQFWKPGTVAPGSSLDRASEAEGHVVQSAPMIAMGGIQAQREQLPIFKHSGCGSCHFSIV